MITVTEIPYGGWKRNLRITDGTLELVVTLDVGPRVLRLGFLNDRNVFKEFSNQLGRSGETEWQIRGGHRFWTAPETLDSYTLDNTPVEWKALDAETVEIPQPVSSTGWQKILRIRLAAQGAITVTHLLRNAGTQPLSVTPWALSVMAPGGLAVIPQPNWRPHPSERSEGSSLVLEDFLPNRRMILWKFAELGDSRFTWGRDFWTVRHDANKGATKFGLYFAGTWVAYQLGDSVFAKTIPLIPGATYPDDGVNFELFTNRDILEIESLAPMEILAPQTERIHVEEWKLLKVKSDICQPDEAQKLFSQLVGA